MRSTMVTVALVLTVLAGLAHAEIPQVISYQGKVTDGSGNPVADGSYTMRFRIYDAVTGGTLAWDSGDRTVSVSGGVFSVLLGESPQPALTLAFDEDLWLLVRFNGVDQTPRTRLTAVGYAYMASGLVPGTEVTGPVFGGLGAALASINTAEYGTTYGLRAESASEDGRGVFARASSITGSTYGVYAEAASSVGHGVLGVATATTGWNYGVAGRSYSTAGRGVQGWVYTTTGTNYGVLGHSPSSSGRGVYGEATATSGSAYGVYGLSGSSAGRGVFGEATATVGSCSGVYGANASTSGRGVYGSAMATRGQTYGVYGVASSTGGRGVYGSATASSGLTYGGMFISSSPEGIGVRALGGYAGVYAFPTEISSTCYGVYAISESSLGAAVYAEATATTGFPRAMWAKSTKIAIEAQAYGSSNPTAVNASAEPTDGVGVSASGAVAVEGRGRQSGGYFEDTTSYVVSLVSNDTYSFWGTGLKSFVQNHPEDKSRVIAYAAVEGDEAATYTRGTARLTDGIARVSLGETFKWVTNPDIGLTAHLTPRGQWAGLYVVALTTEELVVASHDTTSDAAFDYVVYGLRIGFEEQCPIQEKTIDAPIPSMASQHDLYARHPELRCQNPLNRFTAMRTAAGEPVPDLSGAQALLSAIETSSDPSARRGAPPTEDPHTPRRLNLYDAPDDECDPNRPETDVRSPGTDPR